MNDMNEKNSGEVRKKRQELYMPQETLADRIDKTAGFSGQLERGESLLKLETLQPLAQALGIDLNALLADDTVPSDKVNEVSNLARQSGEQKLNLLIVFAKFFSKQRYRGEGTYACCSL